MKIKSELIAGYKVEHPKLFRGEDTELIELSEKEYLAELERWADNEIAEEAAILKLESEKAALLAKLGITADEALLLLG